MRTTLALDDDVAGKLKLEAGRSGKSFRDVVNETLRRGLASRRDARRTTPFKVVARDLGKLRPGLSLDRLLPLRRPQAEESARLGATGRLSEIPAALGCHHKRAARTADHSFDMVASGSYHDDVRAVGLKTLKNKLSEYVRLAASGEPILVVDRDRIVAELVPPRTGRSERLDDARLAEAVRRGWLTPPLLREPGPPPRAPIAPWAAIRDELDQDRSDR